MTDSAFERTGPGAAETRGAVHGLMGNLVAGFRLAFFLRVRPNSFQPNVDQAMLLALAMAAFMLLTRFLMVLPNPEFNSAGIGPIAASYVAFLLGIWVIAALARGSRHFLPLVVMLTSAQPTMMVVLTAVVMTIASTMEGYGWAIGMWVVFGLAMLWHMLIALRTVRLVLEIRVWRSLLMSAVYMAAISLPLFAIPQVPVWYEGYDIEEVAGVTPPEPIDVERTFYAQPAMVKSRLNSIEQSRPGIVDLYFIGFAGYGTQDVFMNEVQLASSLFDQRFDTTGRSLALVNNRQTIDRLPLANVSNLKLALEGLAERMDRDEDVLFLFLTSHGSSNRLATTFWPLQHNDLGSAELRSMLDEAGIGWRVIVISACYSGSFVDELRSERTLVITASREDRSSFGCSDEADMTYFGRALIDKALRKTRSFTTAFELATESVAAREKAEGLTPSEPQISVGSEIAVKLAALTDRLELLREVAARD